MLADFALLSGNAVMQTGVQGTEFFQRVVDDGRRCLDLDGGLSSGEVAQSAGNVEGHRHA
jgi:hypothetical protein